MKIALIGSKKSGKDYLTDLLKQHKPQYKSIAWADVPKQYCAELYPGIKKYNTPELKDKIINEDWNTLRETPRSIWERVSKEKFEEEKDDRFFHKITLKNIKDIVEEANGNIVVTDTRSYWEYDDLEDMGFVCIYVTREGMPVFRGWDERIKKFYKKIELTYENNTNGLDFINQIDFLEKNTNTKG